MSSPHSEPSADLLLSTAQRWKSAGSHIGILLAVSSLERTAKLINNNLEALLRPHGITLSRFTVLSALRWSADGQMTLGEIAQRLLLHPTSVTSAVDKLEAEKLVKRVPHPHDRRATLAKITDSGRQLVDRATVDLTEAKMGFGDAADDTLERFSLHLRDIRQTAGDTVATARAYRSLFNGS